jgi:DNA-binding transcriptional MerR regulator
MPLKDIREYAILRYQGDSTIQQRLEILEKHKLSVTEEKKRWDTNLQNLNDKIAIYKEKLNN